MAQLRYSLSVGDRIPVHTAVVYKRGAIVNGNQNLVETVTVHEGHDIQIGQKFLYALTLSNIILTRVFTCTGRTATTVSYSGAFTWVNRCLLVPLEADTGGTQNPDGSFNKPNYDGSTVVASVDPNGDDDYIASEVPVEPGGYLGFFTETADVWIIGMDSQRRPVRVFIESGTQGSGTGGGAGVEVGTDVTIWVGDDANPSFFIERNAGVGDKFYVWGKTSDDTYRAELIFQLP